MRGHFRPRPTYDRARALLLALITTAAEEGRVTPSFVAMREHLLAHDVHINHGLLPDLITDFEDAGLMCRRGSPHRRTYRLPNGAETVEADRAAAGKWAGGRVKEGPSLAERIAQWGPAAAALIAQRKVALGARPIRSARLDRAATYVCATD